MNRDEAFDLLLQEMFKMQVCDERGYHEWEPVEGSFFPKCAICNIQGKALNL